MTFALDETERRDRTALIDAATGETWSYAQLSAEVRRRAEELAGARGQVVFHFCQNDLPGVVWYLAALEAGVPVALLPGQLNDTLRARLLELYQPEWLTAAGALQRGANEGMPPHGGLALMLSTSGSTGSPKLVRLTRNNVESNAASICAALGIAALDIAVAHLPIHYSYGLSVLNSHLLAGASVMLTNLGLMTPGFWESIRRYQVNSFSGVPYTYQMLRRLDLDKLEVPSLRIFTQAGGKLDATSVALFHDKVAKRGGSFWVMYGQTEATARIAVLPAADLPRKLGTAGKAIPGGRLSVLDGELIYEGPNVMLGYAQNRDDLARGDELHGRLATGDLATLDDEGFVTIQGRAQRDAKLFGLRVNLDEIENFVKRNGPAAAVAAGHAVVVFCEFGDRAEHQRLRDELAAHLQIHRSGFEFRGIERLPAKSTGKIDYDRLQALL